MAVFLDYGIGDANHSIATLLSFLYGQVFHFEIKLGASKRVDLRKVYIVQFLLLLLSLRAARYT